MSIKSRTPETSSQPNIASFIRKVSARTVLCAALTAGCTFEEGSDRYDAPRRPDLLTAPKQTEPKIPPDEQSECGQDKVVLTISYGLYGTQIRRLLKQNTSSEASEDEWIAVAARVIDFVQQNKQTGAIQPHDRLETSVDVGFYTGKSETVAWQEAADLSERASAVLGMVQRSYGVAYPESNELAKLYVQAVRHYPCNSIEENARA